MFSNSVTVSVTRIDLLEGQSFEMICPGSGTRPSSGVSQHHLLVFPKYKVGKKKLHCQHIKRCYAIYGWTCEQI